MYREESIVHIVNGHRALHMVQSDRHELVRLADHEQEPGEYLFSHWRVHEYLSF
jgi:hypothetical protein